MHPQIRVLDMGQFNNSM